MRSTARRKNATSTRAQLLKKRPVRRPHETTIADNRNDERNSRDRKTNTRALSVSTEITNCGLTVDYLRPLTANINSRGSYRSYQPQTLNRASLVSLEHGHHPPRHRPQCFPQHRGYVRTLRNQSRSFPSFRRCRRAKPRPRDRRA